MIHIPFDNRFIELGDEFFTKAQPAPVKQPMMIQFNHALARELGMVVEDVSEAELALRVAFHLKGNS
ncbi:MAG: hypothetical protein NUV51_08825, partial [Sulfuricaulis sp.]|nr:hypothetical protein [Sulfuricaulis sp.]